MGPEFTAKYGRAIWWNGPLEGEFDYMTVDGLIRDARAQNLRLGNLEGYESTDARTTEP